MEAKTAARFNLSGIGQSIVNGGRNLGRRVANSFSPTRIGPDAPPARWTGVIDEATGPVFSRETLTAATPAGPVRRLGNQALNVAQNAVDPFGGLLDRAGASQGPALRFLGGTLGKNSPGVLGGVGRFSSKLTRGLLDMPLRDMTGGAQLSNAMDILRGKTDFVSGMGRSALSAGRGVAGAYLAGQSLFGDNALTRLSGPFAPTADNSDKNYLQRFVSHQSAPFRNAQGVVRNLPARAQDISLHAADALNEARRLDSWQPILDATMEPLRHTGLPVVSNGAAMVPTTSGAAENPAQRTPQQSLDYHQALNDAGLSSYDLGRLGSDMNSGDQARMMAAYRTFEALPRAARFAIADRHWATIPPIVRQALVDNNLIKPPMAQAVSPDKPTPGESFQPESFARSVGPSSPGPEQFAAKPESALSRADSSAMPTVGSAVPQDSNAALKQQMAQLPTDQLFQQFAGTNPQVQSNPSMLSSMWSWFQSQPREVQIALAAGVGLSLAGLVGSMAGGNSGFGNWAPLMGLAGLGALGYGAYQSGLLGGRSAPTPGAPRGADPAQIMNGLTALAQRAPDHFAPPGSFLRDMWNRTTSRSPANRSQ